MSLIERIENADTKDELEKIGKDELGVDVDKRKGLETIRVDLQSLAEDRASEGQDETPAQNDAASPKEDEPESADTSQEAPRHRRWLTLRKRRIRRVSTGPGETPVAPPSRQRPCVHL